MEYAACGSLTSYVAEQWQRAQHSGLFLSEDEARYFFRVCPRLLCTGLCLALTSLLDVAHPVLACRGLLAPRTSLTGEADNAAERVLRSREWAEVCTSILGATFSPV